MKNSKMTAITDMLLLLVGFMIFLNTLIEIKETILIKKKLFEKVFQNLFLGPIKSVTVDRNDCDQEDDYISFFNYTFPGIVKNVSNTSHLYRGGDIMEDSISYLIKTSYLNIWYDKALCLKRINIKNQTNYLMVPSNEDCKKNYRVCGKLNKFDDKLCVDQSLECPINFINITLSSSINPNDTDYTVLELDKDYKLITSNNKTDNLLPIDFKIGENFPCLEIERISFNPDYPPHPDTVGRELYGCNFTVDIKKPRNVDGLDRRYYLTSSLVKKEFFEYNDLIKKYKNLPEKDGWKNDINNENNRMNLYYRSFIYPNLTCITSEKFDDLPVKIDSLKLIIFIHMCLSLGNIFFLCFSISLLSLVKIIKRIFHHILTIVKILISFIFIGYNIYASKRSWDITKTLSHYINILNSEECNGEFVRSSFSIYKIEDNILNITEINQFLCYCSIVYSLILFMQLVRLFYKCYFRINNSGRTNEARKELGGNLYEVLSKE